MFFPVFYHLHAWASLLRSVCAQLDTQRLFSHLSAGDIFFVLALNLSLRLVRLSRLLWHQLVWEKILLSGRPDSKATYSKNGLVFLNRTNNQICIFIDSDSDLFKSTRNSIKRGETPSQLYTSYNMQHAQNVCFELMIMHYICVTCNKLELRTKKTLFPNKQPHIVSTHRQSVILVNCSTYTAS